MTVILERLTGAFALNCELFFLTLLFSLPLGLVVAFGSMSRCAPLRGVVKTFVWVIRGTPLMVQLMFIFYGLPMIGFTIPDVSWIPNFSRFTAGIVAMSMNSCAYVAEIIRSGIQAVDFGQTEAALSCGMTRTQAMVNIILPQAVKNILPALGNEFVTMIKETSIIQYLGVGDLMYNNGIVVTATYNPLPCYYISAIIYLTLNIVLGKGLDLFERRMKCSDR